MPTVRCSVDSCHYWKDGDVCGADSIWVKNNMMGDVDDELNNLRMEVGDLGAAASASRSSETCCETFRPKGKEKMGGK